MINPIILNLNEVSIIYIYKKKNTSNVFKKIFLFLLILLVFIYIKYPTKIQKLLPQSLNIQSNNILTEDTIINKIKDVKVLNTFLDGRCIYSLN